MIRLLKAHGFDDLSDTDAIEMLNDGQNQLVVDLVGAPLLKKVATFATDANSNTMASQPTDMRQIIELVDIDNSNKLRWMSWDQHMTAHITELDKKGNARIFDFFNSTLFIWPAPEIPVNLMALFTYKPADLTVTPDATPSWLPPEHHRLIPMRALVDASQVEADLDIGEQFMADYTRRFERAREALWTSQYDRSDVVEVVDEDDYWDPIF